MGHYLGRTSSVLWDTGCILNPDPTTWWLLLHGQNTQVRTGRGRSGRGACMEPLHRNAPATLSSAGLGSLHSQGGIASTKGKRADFVKQQDETFTRAIWGSLLPLNQQEVKGFILLARQIVPNSPGGILSCCYTVGQEGLCV